MRQRVFAMCAFALLLAWPASASIDQRFTKPEIGPSPPFEDVLSAYRAGDLEGALAKLHDILTAPKGVDEFVKWRLWARGHNEWNKVEAILFLCTEATLRALQSDAPFIPQLLLPYKTPILQAHGELKEKDRRTPFLRHWYLVWESMLQAAGAELKTKDLDFLDDALGAFPDDPQILLAAGSRHELAWWTSLENSHLDPGGRGTLEARRSLETARSYLRRSVKADREDSEAVLRLTHVLLELGDLDEGLQVIGTFDSSKTHGDLTYLAALLEGKLQEQKGDFAAADAAYDRAISLTPVPQSARLAKAHLAYSRGQRPEAAGQIARALALPRDHADPWWVFVQGQAWRRDAYLALARGLVHP